MEIEILDEDKSKIKIEIDSITFANMINERAWEKPVNFSSFKLDHPYLKNPVLLVSASNPRKVLLDASNDILKDVKKARSSI